MESQCRHIALIRTQEGIRIHFFSGSDDRIGPGGVLPSGRKLWNLTEFHRGFKHKTCSVATAEGRRDLTFVDAQKNVIPVADGGFRFSLFSVEIQCYTILLGEMPAVPMHILFF
jgi:hypothetical protein